jgi:RNA polymerase sigma-32 factor
MARKAEPPPPPAGTEPFGDSPPPAPLSPADLDPSGAPGSGSIVPSDPFRRYLAEIRRYPRLTREEEKELAIRYREKGDAEAARTLATSNLRLVVRIAMDYRRSYLNLLDLIQDGNLGLLHAIKKYDPYRGVPFSAYAGYWIRAYVIKHLLDHWSLVRVGTTNVRRKLFYNLKREKERLEREGIQAGPKLLAEHLGADERDVVEVSQALQGRDVSMDQPVRGSGEGKDRLVWETMSTGEVDPSEQVARKQLQDLLKEKIAAFASGLKERDRYILEARMVADEPVTLQAIGDKFGTTREAVRQAEARLVKKLKEYLRAEIKDLEDFEIQTD